MSEHYILLGAELTPQATNNFIALLLDLARQGAKKVAIAMTSPGGNVTGGIAVYNTLRSMPYEVRTHNIGNVDSIGNAVFLAGTDRAACAASTFMFHGVGFNPNPAERLEEPNLRAKLDTITADHGRISTIIAERTKLTVPECMVLFQQQTTLGPAWALEKGIITDICDFQFPAGGNILTFV